MPPAALFAGKYAPTPSARIDRVLNVPDSVGLAYAFAVRSQKKALSYQGVDISLELGA